MQRWKTGKISIFNSLNVIFDFLMSQIENLNQVLTWDQYQVESECWNWVFELSQKIDIKYLSQVRRLILKLDSTISLRDNINCNHLKKSLLFLLSYSIHSSNLKSFWTHLCLLMKKNLSEMIDKKRFVTS